MELAEVIVALNTLPALGMLAVFLFFSLLRACAAPFLLGETQIIVFLPEIESLSGMNFTSDCLLEVLVAYFAIAISVKFVEEGLKLSFGDPPQTPMMEVELQLLRLNGT